MHIYIKYGVSVAALLVTLSLAHAQSEHQGGGKEGGEAVQHAQPERGKEGGAKERAPAAQERSKGETHASPAKRNNRRSIAKANTVQGSARLPLRSTARVKAAPAPQRETTGGAP